MESPTGRSLRAAVLGALSLAPLAGSARGQGDAGACTAELSPAAIRVESPGVRVTARLSRDIGGLTAVDDAGGVRLSTAAELELIAKTSDRAAEEPIALSDDGRTAILWLNTEDAEPGTRTLTLEGEGEACTSELTVEGLEEAGIGR